MQRWKFLPYYLLAYTEKKLMSSYVLTKQTIEHSPPWLLEMISKKKAMFIHNLAVQRVPAYEKFLRGKRYKDIEAVPLTDKHNYVKQYGYEQRCVNGAFPRTGNIEESSGSSGTPTNWIRSVTEGELLFKVAEFEFFYTFNADKKDYIVLSGWSSGPWATGLKFYEIISHYTLVKNSTADCDNIVRTMQQLGLKYNYLITGYPPFLKRLLDSDAIQWKKYKIDLLTGGEGTSLEWKDYIKKRLGNKDATIISSYGASDIDIGIGFETPFTEFIRKQANVCPALNEALFKTSENPILFQYNPLMHYIENTDEQEFSVTLLDDSVVSPKIKYNLHDHGGRVGYQEMIALLEKHRPKQLQGFLAKYTTLKLPMLYVLGRTDGTISIGGNNIYPSQVDVAIHGSRHARKVNRFMIERGSDGKMNVCFLVHVELKAGVKASISVKKELERSILAQLLKENLEYKEYYHNHPANRASLKPRVKLYAFNKHSLFTKQDGKIKQQYIVK